MTIPSWPSTVPYASEQEYWNGAPFRAPLSTEMEGGNIRLRRRPGDNIGTYAWGRILKPTEASDLNTFLMTTLNNGASRFTMQVSRDGTTYTSRVVQLVAGSLKYASAGGDKTLVTFNLTVFPSGVTS